MSSNHDTYPGTPSPELALSTGDIEFLENFNSNLRHNHYSYEDQESFQMATEDIIRSNVEGVLVTNKVDEHEGFALMVVAEALGATRSQSMTMGLLDVLSESSLLNNEDKNILNGLNDNIWMLKNSSIPEDEMASSFEAQVGNTLMQVRQLEATGEDKNALILGLMAYYAGATIRFPEFQAAEQLMQEVVRYQAAEQL